MLGYNEIINGDFESAELMKYWWSRSDWNGGVWQREAQAPGSAAVPAWSPPARRRLPPSTTPAASIRWLCPHLQGVPPCRSGCVYLHRHQRRAGRHRRGVGKRRVGDCHRRFVAPPAARLSSESWPAAFADGEKVYIDDIELRQVGGDPSGNPQTGDAVPSPAGRSLRGIAGRRRVRRPEKRFSR